MSKGHLFRVADQVLNRPLLILPEKLAVISAVLGGRIGIDAAGLDLDQPMPEATRFKGSSVDEDAASGRRSYMPYRRTPEGVAIITITGSLVNRGAWVGASSGLTSYEGIKFQLEQASADPKAKAILIDIESPGGQAIGAFETADAVRAAAAVKQVWVVVNGMAASAAYAIASAADRIVTTPSGISGSIGVVMMHADYSRMLDQEGITPTLIHAGAHKVDANPFEPLSDAVKADLQAEIGQLMDMFVASVAAGRKDLSPEAIRATEARTFIGQAAVDVGLADAIGSFDDVLADLSRGTTRSNRSPRTASMNFTQADVDAAHAKGVQEGEAKGHAAGHAAGLAAGTKAGAEAERARLVAIVDHPEAEGRSGQALALAKEGAPADLAATMLKTSPKGEAATGVTLEERGKAANALLPKPDTQGAGSGKGAETKKAPIDASAIYAARRAAV